ncbi:DUF2063 domain-containing protein [Kineobactrum salinum]|uniref:DUF2063 domain-containing protein n=2 Tax=Kineobactrum salinum TaxID=2708301 RepID=A0A6C0U654_9GAMM|nr:DUF2063 domain-containing protein [Kineobactrum salinum]
MARYLRNPESVPPPANVEARRLKIYRDLVYNNIEGFISNGFPVLRSLYQTSQWHALVREFIDGHRCHTPYFLEISQEFVQFLLQRPRCDAADPPFIAELAHYEWVELALDVAEEQLPPATGADRDPLTGIPRLSPLAWVLSYRYPVHRIGPGFQPAIATEPTFLTVYRDLGETVRFMEINAATARLLELTRDNEVHSGADLLQQLATELDRDPRELNDFGAAQLSDFVQRSVVLYS